MTAGLNKDVLVYRLMEKTPDAQKDNIILVMSPEAFQVIISFISFIFQHSSSKNHKLLMLKIEPPGEIAGCACRMGEERRQGQ